MSQTDRPVKAKVTFDAFRANKHGDCWLRIIAPALEVPSIMITNLWDDTVKLYVFAQLEGQKPVEVGAFWWNTATQTSKNERRITLRSTMKVLNETSPHFDFDTLINQSFDIVLALPEQIRRAHKTVVEKDVKDEQPVS